MLEQIRRIAKWLWRRGRRSTAHEMDAQDFGWYRGDSKELLPNFRVGDGDVVVDVGCGHGGTSCFAAACGAEVIAVDIDPDTIRRVQSKLASRAHRPFQALVSDCRPLPLADGVATCVIAQEVMEHVDDPPAFLAELVRVGKPGARYLITVPDAVGENLQRHFAPDVYWQKPNHIHIFQRDELDRLVGEAGLRIEQRTSYSFYWTMWWTLFWAAGVDCPFGSGGAPVLNNWNKTWKALLKSPHGEKVKNALNDFMPKSQIILARKAA